MTFTGFIGAVCMYPLRAIIRASVALGIHPNTLTLIGVLIVVAAAFALGLDHFRLAFLIMLLGSIFDNPEAVRLTPAFVEEALRQAGFEIDATEVMLPGITMLTKAHKPG